MMVKQVQPLKTVLNQSTPVPGGNRELETLFKLFEEFKRSKQMLTYDDICSFV